MKRRHLLFVFFMLTALATKAQTAPSVQVNPDGTHTVVHHAGSTSIQVNPDGTHSSIFHHGSTSTRVNPNGTHSVIFHNGSTSTQVNPDGTHSVLFHIGPAATQVNPDGTHTVISPQGRRPAGWVRPYGPRPVKLPKLPGWKRKRKQ
jgi:hypothetical protein